MKKSKDNRIVRCAAFLLNLLCFAGVIYYIFVVFRDEMTADCVDTMFWTQMMVDYNKIFAPNFRYAALIPFGGQLFMYPFVKIFGVTMMAQMLSMALFAAAFGAAVYFCMREVFESRALAHLSVALLNATLLASVKLREIFWGHIIYYSLGVLFLMVALYLACKMLSRDWDKRFNRCGLFLGVWIFLTATDGLLSLVQCMAPLFGALVLQWCFNKERKFEYEKKIYAVGVLICAAGLLGYITGIMLQGNMTAGYADAYSSFDASSDWMDNLMKLMPQWYLLLGVDVKSGDLFLSGKGILNLLRVVYATVVAAIPVIMLFLLPKVKRVSVRLLIFAHWVMTAIIMLAYVFGKLSAGSWRLSPIVCSGSLLLIAFLQFCLESVDLKRLGILFGTACAAICVLYSAVVLTKDSKAYKENDYYKLAQFLQKKDCTYGYATFWNAGVITLMSDSSVKVRNIKTDKGIEIYNYQTDRTWYEDQPGQTEYFLLLTKNEYTKLANMGDEKLEGYRNYYEFGNYYILVFGENIF